MLDFCRGNIYGVKIWVLVAVCSFILLTVLLSQVKHQQCLSPSQLMDGNYLPLITSHFFEYYGLLQLVLDGLLILLYYSYMFPNASLCNKSDTANNFDVDAPSLDAQHQPPPVKSIVFFVVVAYILGFAGRGLTIGLLFHYRAVQSYWLSNWRSCAGGLTPILATLVAPYTLSIEDERYKGLLAIGGISAILIITAQAIFISPLAWPIAYNVVFGFVTLLLSKMGQFMWNLFCYCRSYKDEQAESWRKLLACCSVRQVLKLLGRLVVFTGLTTVILHLALGADLHDFAIAGLHERAIDNSRPVYKDSDVWLWTEDDKQVLQNIPRPLPVSEQKREYWKRHPSPELKPYPGYDIFWSAVMRHQFPASCENQKFFVFDMINSGMGDDLHKLSWALAVGMQTGRIFLLNPDQIPWKWADRDFCGSVLLPECYLMPFTNCSIPDGATSELQVNGRPITSNATALYFRRDLPGAWEGTFNYRHVPTQFAGLADSYHITPSVWWRTVSTGFLMRPNPRFGRFLNEVYEQLWGHDEERISRSFGIHVRHGDKGLDGMRLVPLAEYIEAAEAVRNSTQFGYMGASDVILLSTEDPAVIDDAKAWNTNHPNGTQWQFIYLNDMKVNNQYSVTHARWHVVNAFLTAKADAFVLTTLSNWCRLLNEMRKVDGKMEYPFVDFTKGEIPWK